MKEINFLEVVLELATTYERLAIFYYHTENKESLITALDFLNRYSIFAFKLSY